MILLRVSGLRLRTPLPLPSGGLITAVVAVKAVTAVKFVGAVGGPNWELQLPIRSSNIYIKREGFCVSVRPSVCHSEGP